MHANNKIKKMIDTHHDVLICQINSKPINKHLTSSFNLIK